MRLRLRICRDAWGTWSVYGLSPLPVSHLPSLSASIDYAAKESAAAPATIELLIDGIYAVIHQERGWPRQLLAPERAWPEPPSTKDKPAGPPTLSRFFHWARGRNGRNSDQGPATPRQRLANKTVAGLT